jgi:DNA mismatch repair protein MutS
MELAKNSIATWAGLPADPNPLRLEFRETLGPVLTGNKATMKILTERLGAMNRPPPFPGIRIQSKKTSPGLEIPHLETLYRGILNTRADLAAAVRKALPGLCDQLVASSLKDWDTLEGWLSLVDVTFTLWRVSEQLGFVRPMLVPGDSAKLQIEGLRHPLIEATGIRTEYVRHSVTLDGDTSGWLVYGMNASGKSSLMKAVGICVLLAQAGCYVPASRCVLTPFRGLYTRILNTDNLWSGLSSYAVEITELREILNRADAHSLVLGDELCSGTESVSATALVGSSLVKLHDRGARFIFATHLHGLMDRQCVRTLPKLKVWHLKVRYDPAADRLIYERVLTPGAGSTLYGLEVARAMNIPDDVLDLAHKIRREMLGTAAANEAPLSDWNKAIARRACEMCGCDIVRDLEVHHIQPRESANRSGRLEDGTHQNHVRNLVVVCAKCHDRHHSGEALIGPLITTSDGPQRIPITTEVPERRPGTKKWMADQITTIEAYLRNYPNVTPKRIAYDLETKEGICISVQSLSRMRSNLPKAQ